MRANLNEVQWKIKPVNTTPFLHQQKYNWEVNIIYSKCKQNAVEVFCLWLNHMALKKEEESKKQKISIFSWSA